MRFYFFGIFVCAFLYLIIELIELIGYVKSRMRGK